MEQVLSSLHRHVPSVLQGCVVEMTPVKSQLHVDVVPLLHIIKMYKVSHNRYRALGPEITPMYIVHCSQPSGVTIGRARRAVHAGPALWGAQNLPDAVFFKFFG